MTIKHGGLVLLAAGNGGGPETFSTIGGMRLTRLALTQRAQEANTLESGAWRRFLSSAGARSLTISGSGVFTDSAAEQLLSAHAFAGESANYRLTFPDGDTVTAAFVVTQYERSGQPGREEEFSLTLESGGEVTYASA